MKCNNCGTKMRLAGYDSDGFVLFSILNPPPAHGKVGKLIYCPVCGNIQVDLSDTIVKK